ncbi:DgyrCDS12021 [Dimorphilus gyrociliatus]|uniref:DgyrCDS12021 n=1 Tax=Dimorphilus gyrociliatus TaxID=2664684 RepID=A0A7I8W8F8_9ANNE|nr:DgyrCDS12021 [Dimorphilus gyrociliatus]
MAHCTPAVYDTTYKNDFCGSSGSPRTTLLYGDRVGSHWFPKDYTEGRFGNWHNTPSNKNKDHDKAPPKQHVNVTYSNPMDDRYRSVYQSDYGLLYPSMGRIPLQDMAAFGYASVAHPRNESSYVTPANHCEKGCNLRFSRHFADHTPDPSLGSAPQGACYHQTAHCSCRNYLGHVFTKQEDVTTYGRDFGWQAPSPRSQVARLHGYTRHAPLDQDRAFPWDWPDPPRAARHVDQHWARVYCPLHGCFHGSEDQRCPLFSFETHSEQKDCPHAHSCSCSPRHKKPIHTGKRIEIKS